MTASRSRLDERFTGTDLDPDIWFPYYLPHWSSRSESAATYSVSDGQLRLIIPVDQPLWCPDLHEEPLRVSCLQTGCLSGPLGSPIGQQPFREGLLVREEQPTFWGFTPLYGEFEIRMRGIVTSRSMFAFWMSGIEDQPRHSGEICVAEIFGEAIEGGSAGVGMGIKQYRDPGLSQVFSVVRVDIDVTDFHTFGVRWEPGLLEFRIDGDMVRRLAQAPDYPVQLMLGVFDFPARAEPNALVPVPELIVSRVRGGGAPSSLP